MRATYIGPIQHLRGEVADVVIDGATVHAQFDNTTLTKTGRMTAPVSCDPRWPHESLGFGRHVFAAVDFDVILPAA